MSRFETLASLGDAPKTWLKILAKVRDGEMPPEDEERPAKDELEQFVEWTDRTLRVAACEDGLSPGPALTRRLNRDEYAATIRDLLGLHFNVAAALPADGAGGEGFDNTAETLFLSPVHLEKYLDAANQALGYAFKDDEARERLLIREPKETTEYEAAARRVLERFLPLAFRRPTSTQELDDYVELFNDAIRTGESFEASLHYALQGVLVSPHFLFRVEQPVSSATPQRLGDYELACRLSYFLWGSMPDRKLFDVARAGRLHDAETLEREVRRLLKDSRARGFARSFIEQWLGTRELGRDIKPDRSLSRSYDDNLEAVIRYEPVLFFQEILKKDLSLLTVLDADFSYMNNRLARHYRLPTKGLREHPKRVTLPEGSPRGGVLGMAAVLAVSSYPHRTSPVLRGKWVLDTILGAPPPPPPPNVPALEETGEDTTAATVRERLAVHRANPECASCHDRMDPIGFGLENFDVLGRWRTRDGGKPVDSRGRLPDGSTFEGPQELKAILLSRKEQFLVHLTSQLLGFALNRGLTIEDYCTVNSIVRRTEADGYPSQAVIIEIVRSVPFSYKAGTDPRAAVLDE